MIRRLLEFSLRNRLVIIAIYAGLAGWGWWALLRTPIDAIPDLSDNQVIVFTDWSGHGPQEVEDQVTYPLTVSLQGLPGVRVVRSQSAFGFSMIYVVLVDQVATVHIGDGFRVASLVKGTTEAVGGVVVARSGTNTNAVIQGIKARIEEIQPGLPAGVLIVPFYDRSTLIERAVNTLRTALIEEILLVTLAHVVFLMHVRSILIVTIPLPLAVLASFLGMYYAGISSNIMSLAGIAIAIGVLVDAGIVVTENAFRVVEQRSIDTRDRRAVMDAILDSTRLVGRPVFFSMAIILLAFVPVFA
jgi:Cu/Ag efflux pump CusA